MDIDVHPQALRSEAFVARLARDLADSFTPVAGDEAEEIADRLFGVRGRATRFSTEKDDTFRIDATDGRRYVLKVSNPHESADELHFQVAVVRHIRQVAPELPVADVFQGVSGGFVVGLTTRAAEKRNARLYSYLEGTPLDTVRTTTAQRYQIGEILAKLRLAMASFVHPAQHRVLAWDVKNFAKLAPLIDCVKDPLQRRLIEQALARYDTIADDLSRCRAQVLHNDFNRSNIVVDLANESSFIAGIIDFGDAVHTAVAIDVATAVMNQFPLDFDASKHDDLFADSRDLVRGYLAHAPLTQEELRLIPHLAMARGATRALLSTWRADLFPHNAAYILRFTASDWVHLRWLLEQDQDSLSTALLAAPEN